MTSEGLLGFLLAAAICALLAFLVAWLLRVRMSVLAYVGAGLLGRAIGLWLARLVKGEGLPGELTFAGASVHILWTLIGTLLVVLVVKLLGRARR
jgi:hypothetical protein